MKTRRTIYLRRLNTGFNSKFSVGYPDRHTRDEARRTQPPKYCDNNNQDEENSSDKNRVNNDMSCSQKFRQTLFVIEHLKEYNYAK